MRKTWLFGMILICLVLAAVVYAAPRTITLEPGDEAYVSCVDDQPIQIERRDETAVVYCVVAPVIPPPATEPAPQQTPRPTPTAPTPGDGDAYLPATMKDTTIYITR